MPTKLGQHFLINKNKLREIVEALDLKTGDVVIEIGPGHGELTREIIARLQNCKIKKIIAIEKDEKLARDLRSKIYDLRLDIEIITGDVLKILPKLITNYHLPIANYKLVGNIPYYITGHLFRIIGELKNKPPLIVLTIQKEVAERICAEPPRMNLLAVSIQFWAEPKIVGFISKKHFQPQPKVDSAIIKLRPHQTNYYLPITNYYRFIKILFKQPRKTILNNLASGIKHQEGKEEIINKLKKLKINPQSRPQDLKIEQIEHLSTFF